MLKRGHNVIWRNSIFSYRRIMHYGGKWSTRWCNTLYLVYILWYTRLIFSVYSPVYWDYIQQHIQHIFSRSRWPNNEGGSLRSKD